MFVWFSTKKMHALYIEGISNNFSKINTESSLPLWKIQRTKFGKWVDRIEITQNEIAKKSKVGRTTISNMSSDSAYAPKYETFEKVKRAFKKWDMILIIMIFGCKKALLILAGL